MKKTFGRFWCFVLVQIYVTYKYCSRCNILIRVLGVFSLNNPNVSAFSDCLADKEEKDPELKHYSMVGICNSCLGKEGVS